MGGDRPRLHKRSGEPHRRKPNKQAVPSAFGSCRLSATPIPRPPTFVRDAFACPGGCAAGCYGGARPFPDRDDNEYLLACHPRVAVAGSSSDGCPVAGSGSVVAGLIWTFAVSQPYHAFPAPDGSRGTRRDSREAEFKFSRPPAEPAGQSRTRPRHGSGP